MSITIDNFPKNDRTVFTGVSFHGHLANETQTKVILVGSVGANATVKKNELTRIVGNNWAEMVGAGSMLDEMIEVAVANNNASELYIYAKEDIGTATEWEVALTGNAGSDGYCIVAINSEIYRVRVQSSDTLTEIAKALEVKINADKRVCVVATATADKIKLVSKAKNEVSKTIDITDKARNVTSNIKDLVVTITRTVEGSTNPDCQDFFDYISNTDKVYNYIAMGYNDTLNMNYADDVYNDLYPKGYISPLQAKFGCIFFAKKGTVLERIAFGETRNNMYMTTLGFPAKSHYSEWQAVSSFANLESKHKTNAIDVSRPMQGRELQGIHAYELQDSQQDRNALLHAGISTVKVDTKGYQVLERDITMYRKDDLGNNDISGLDLNTPYQLFYIANYLKADLSRAFQNSAITDRAVSSAPAVINIEDVRRRVTYLVRRLNKEYVIENIEETLKLIIVERDTKDPTCIKIGITVDLVNGLRQMKILVDWYLQFDGSQNL